MRPAPPKVVRRSRKAPPEYEQIRIKDFLPMGEYLFYKKVI